MTLLLVFSLAISLLALIWLTVLSLRLRSFEKVRTLLLKGEETDLSVLIGGFMEGEERLKRDILTLSEGQRRTAEVLRGAVQKMGVVRFDAFDDTGGNLSFAAALLNEHGDGVVISAINGRNESRAYAKPVKSGNSIYLLSKEEEEAIARAMNYQPASSP